MFAASSDGIEPAGKLCPELVMVEDELAEEL
jgi:hypothetical protein